MIRPLRSMLFTPGSDQKKIEKALTLQADSLILDLEDAEAKVTSRTRAIAPGGLFGNACG